MTEVMSFGSPTPIAVHVVGTDLDMVRQHAEKIADEMKRIPFLRDVQFEQTLDYPTVEIDVDREKAGLSGITVEDVAQGGDRGDVVEPVRRAQLLDRREDRLRLPGRGAGAARADDQGGRRRDFADRAGQPPGQPDDPRRGDGPREHAARRVRPRDVAALPELTANVEGEDMGRASRQVAQAIAAAGEPPRGVRVIPMGQLPPMNEMFKSLGIGLAIAVFVILLLLTAYFQSPRLALISIGAVPGVLAGIATILYFTGTTLNIESFMGSIMCLGVSVSNSVMLVTFMNDHWKTGSRRRRRPSIGASDRLRPILMTACAMTVGMVPMALALERGSQMQAPLGRAVIGGLVMSTLATLLVVPSIFALVIGRRKARSPSIYPDDPDSPHYDPEPVVAERGRDPAKQR